MQELFHSYGFCLIEILGSDFLPALFSILVLFTPFVPEAPLPIDQYGQIPQFFFVRFPPCN